MAYEGENPLNPWIVPGEKMVVEEGVIDRLVEMISGEEQRPRWLHEWMKQEKMFLSVNQMRAIRERCDRDRAEWADYEHVLCSRVLDRWNLRQRWGVEGYYYHSYNYASENDGPKDIFDPSIIVRMNPRW